MIKLTVLSGPDAGSEFTLKSDTVVIGRASTCDVMLHDGAMGRRHCTIQRTGDSLTLADLGSVNGTFVNDSKTRVDTCALKNGDEISFGKSRMRVALVTDEKEKPLSARSRPAQKNISPSESAATAPSSVIASPQAEEITEQASLPEKPEPHIQLRVIEGKEAGKVWTPKPHTKQFTVGRGQAADFQLQDAKVSRIHFTVELTPAGFVLTDNNSRNGTFLNDVAERVSRVPLQGGEEIRVSETRLKVEIIYPGDETVIAPSSPLSKTAQPVQSTARERPRPISIPRAIPPELRTKPRLSPLQAALIVMFVATGTSWGFLLFGKSVFFSSGPVSISHAEWEGECTTCHPPWSTQSINATCGTASCHASVLQVNTTIRDACVDCHTEHRGRGFNITGNATQCWGCHETGYDERPVWAYYKQVLVASGERAKGPLRLQLPSTDAERRTWQRSVPQEESGLIFAHTAHARDSGITTCEACHQPLPGEIINALGVISAFPTHAECIDCHPEVVATDPRVASTRASAQCRKCHTRDDGRITRAQRSVTYVQFSHDDHKSSACDQCHFTVNSERTYLPVLHSSVLYPLPMEACMTCHEQQNATTACLDCHRAHHRAAPEVPASMGWLSHITLSKVLFGLLVVVAGVCLYTLTTSQSDRY